MNTVPAMPPSSTAAPPGVGPAPPGAPPGAPPFQSALAEHWARTANAEGHKGADGHREEKGHGLPRDRRAGAEGDPVASATTSTPAVLAAATSSAVQGAASTPAVVQVGVSTPAVVQAGTSVPASTQPAPASADSPSVDTGEAVPAAATAPTQGATTVALPLAGQAPLATSTSETEGTSQAPLATSTSETEGSSATPAQAPPRAQPLASDTGSSVTRTTASASTPLPGDPSISAGTAASSSTTMQAQVPPQSTPSPQAPAAPAQAPVETPLQALDASATHPAPDAPASTSDLPSAAPNAGTRRGGSDGHSAADRTPTSAIDATKATTRVTSAEDPLEVAVAATESASAPTPGAEAPSATGVGMQDMIDAIRATVELAVRQGSTQARIALQPAELGEIHIHLSQTAEGLLARVTADTPAAAQALAQGRSELHQSLSSLGLPLVRLDLDTLGQPQTGERQDPGAGDPQRLASTTTQTISEDDGSAETVGELDAPSVSLDLGARLVDVLA